MNKKCEYCNKEHNSDYGSDRFCSSVCARGYSTKNKRDDINKKVSKTLTGCKRLDSSIRIPLDKRSLGGKRGSLAKKVNSDRLNEQLYLNKEYNKLCNVRNKPKVWYKEKILKEQEYKCIKCGLIKWLRKNITLELHHKDGNKNNNERNNLIYLCPNCHSQTDNFRGRNKRG